MKKTNSLTKLVRITRAITAPPRGKARKNSKLSLLAVLVLTGVLFYTANFFETPTEPNQPSVLGEQNNSTTEQGESPTESYTVTSVSDGDTIKVLINATPTTVRIANINAPESVDPRRPVECMGIEASTQLKNLVEGKTVRLEADETQSPQDRYGRLVRFVFLEDGTDVGLEMITGGFAQSTPYGNSAHKYLETYFQAEKVAKANQRGLWNRELCPEKL